MIIQIVKLMMIKNLVDYASSGTGEMISTIVIVLLAIGVAFIGIKSLVDSFKSKEDDPETAERKKIAKEELRAQAYLWTEEVAEMRQQYAGKVPAEVLRSRLAAFNERHGIMQ